jgi:transcriptional regulator with XRE-family HTH domain
VSIARDVIEAVDAPVEPPKRARAIRTALGLRRRKVARSAGLTRHQLAATERGRRALTQSQWRSLAGSLGVDAELLVPGAESSADDVDTSDGRIDEFLGLDADHEWAMVPRTAADLPPSLPVALPGRSWSEIRQDLDGVTACCDRLIRTASRDDADALLDMLDAAAHEVRFRTLLT